MQKLGKHPTDVGTGVCVGDGVLLGSGVAVGVGSSGLIVADGSGVGVGKIGVVVGEGSCPLLQKVVVTCPVTIPAKSGASQRHPKPQGSVKIHELLPAFQVQLQLP